MHREVAQKVVMLSRFVKRMQQDEMKREVLEKPVVKTSPKHDPCCLGNGLHVNHYV
jgi:hypothetical protein